MRAILITLALATFAAGARQDDPPSIAESVDAVVSGGYWETGDATGRYRAVIVNAGFEHVTSSLWLEWIADPTRSEPARMVERVLVRELSSGIWSIGIDRNEAFLDGQLRLTATNPYSLENESFEVTAGMPGDYVIE